MAEGDKLPRGGGGGGGPGAMPPKKYFEMNIR